MRVRLFLLVIVCAFSLLGPAPASRADTIDQSFVGPPTGINGGIGGSFTYLAQTYTAGITGTLTGVNIDVVTLQPAALQVSIHTVSGGVPTGTILGTTTLAVGQSAPLSLLITFSGVISQFAGTQYAIVLGYPSSPPGAPANGFWTLQLSNPYPGGQVFYGNDFSNWNPWPTADGYFQTHVQPGIPVPEPGTLLLVCTGVASLLSRRRKLI